VPFLQVTQLTFTTRYGVWLFLIQTAEPYTPMDLNKPAWDQLCALTTSWLLTAQSAAEEREIWALKLRCRKLYEASPDPEGISRRMLQILTRPSERQQAA
jgi:hypothetical protein